MPQEKWTAVDDYFDSRFLADDPVLVSVLADADAQGLPDMNVAPNQGQLLQLLAQIQGAETILEIGTLAGYSTIWLGRALPPHGRLISLEYEPHYATVARQNIQRAGLAGRVEIITGSALDTLPEIADRVAPVDMIFIDADKPNNPHYIEWAFKLSRPGSLIVVDNVVRKGEVANPESDDERVIGTRRMSEWIAAQSGITCTAIQTVGRKGYDGFLLIRVTW